MKCWKKISGWSRSLIICLALMPLRVGAQEVPSQAETTFKANSGIIQPVDPDDGENIVPVQPPTQGPLSLNYASNISFGQHKRKSQSAIFYANTDWLTNAETGLERTSPNFVQVTDLRGTATGWLLSVRQNGPLTNADGVALVGAKLTVSAVAIESQTGMTQVPSDLVKEQVLTDDGKTYHPLVKAEAGTGIGTWTIFLGAAGDEQTNVSLSVPKNVPQKAGKYKTTLSWSLQDAL